MDKFIEFKDWSRITFFKSNCKKFKSTTLPFLRCGQTKTTLIDQIGKIKGIDAEFGYILNNIDDIDF